MTNKKSLQNKRVAILSANGFEQSELFEPRKALIEAGAEVDVVSLEKGKIKGWDKDEWGDSIAVDKLVADSKSSDYDALVIPGGLFNPDTLRNDKQVVDFVKSFFKNGLNKPVAAICHGPWVLVEADVVKGRKMTSYPSIQTDLKNAGAIWEDSEVVVDGGIITSRNPNDIPAFNDKLIAEINTSRHANAA